MKCQNCGNYEASFHYTSNINGHITEAHLCSDCAAKMEYDRHFYSAEREFNSMFRDMFYGIRGYRPPFGINMPRPVSAPPQMGILEKQSVTVDEDMKKRRELNILREQMRQAAEREDFERAIELREELRKYEG